jgi:hypothetical protein
VDGSRVFIAARDSLALEPGDVVTFTLGKRKMASGTLERSYDRELAVVRLSSGSLERVRKRERLLVQAERPRLQPLSRLRVGVPATGRSNSLFHCRRVSFRSPLPDSAYRSESQRDGSLLLVRGPGVALQTPWPDTLLIRFFDDAADQEIALERGELDAAVWWPGELSRHMRAQSRWQSHFSGAKGLPVLSTPALRPHIRAIGPDALAGALDCADRP